MSKPDLSAGTFRRRCHESLRRLIEHGVNNYDRLKHLPRLLPNIPFPIRTDNRTETLQIVRCLAEAMQLEKDLGRAGHHRYDLNRHIGLRQALRAELRQLRQSVLPR